MNPLKFILYCRKSTDTDDKQILSLDSQENELKELVKKENYQIVEVLRESMSAKAPGRPIFNEMLKKIKAGKADAILCWKIDRITRNPIDSGQLQWLLQNSIIKLIRTYEKSYLPTDNAILMGVESSQSSQFIRDLSENVKRGNRAKLEKGEWTCRALFGYKNDKVNKKIIIDPVKSKYAIRAFELYSTGSHSFKEISDILYDEGLRTNGKRGKYFKGSIHKFIDNPFYYGLMLRDGKLYPGNHTPLITKELFDKVQDVLHDRHRPRPQNHFFPLRGFLKCEKCGCALTSAVKKGHHYYYCTNGRGNCSEHKKYLRENTLYPIIASLFEKMNIDEEAIEMMYQSAKEQCEHDFDYSESILTTHKNRLNELTDRESKLLDAFLDKQISKPVYDSKALEIQNDKTMLTKQISDIEQKRKNSISTLEPIKEIFLRASRAKKEFLSGDDQKKREVVETILWNISLQEQKMANYKLKSPYCIISKLPKNPDFLTLWA